MSSPDWRSFDLYAPTPEHALLADTLREFVAREVEPQAAEHDRAERFNHPLFRKAGALGLLGVTLPPEYGGAGLDATAAVQLLEALSTSDPGFALAVLAHGVLFAQNVAVNGNEAQKRRVLPRAASGEWIGGLCMTEPDVGTDVLAMRTRAKRDGDVYVIDGRKTFITNGGTDERTLGDAFVVYAATGEREITSFLVEKGMPGFALGQKWKDKLGMRASFTAELVFDGVRVPAANRLGEEGQGTLQMMRNLEIERLTLAAMSLGIAQRSLRVMVDWANSRKTFGASTGRSSATSRKASPSGARRAPSSTTPRAASTSRRRASAPTPTPPSSSPRRSASASPTPRSRCSAAMATWARTWSSASGATPSCSRSAAARSRPTTRT
jgi:isovaleryl-CoA dehydrogenase